MANTRLSIDEIAKKHGVSTGGGGSGATQATRGKSGNRLTIEEIAQKHNVRTTNTRGASNPNYAANRNRGVEAKEPKSVELDFTRVQLPAYDKTKTSTQNILASPTALKEQAMGGLSGKYFGQDPVGNANTKLPTSPMDAAQNILSACEEQLRRIRQESESGVNDAYQKAVQDYVQKNGGYGSFYGEYDKIGREAAIQAEREYLAREQEVQKKIDTINAVISYFESVSRYPSEQRENQRLLSFDVETAKHQKATVEQQMQNLSDKISALYEQVSGYSNLGMTQEMQAAQAELERLRAREQELAVQIETLESDITAATELREQIAKQNRVEHLDLGAAKNQLEAYEHQLKNIDRKIDLYKGEIYAPTGKVPLSEAEAELPRLSALRSDIEDRMRQLQLDIFSAEKLQTARGYDSLADNADFEQYAQLGAVMPGNEVMLYQNGRNLAIEDAENPEFRLDLDKTDYQLLTENELSTHNYILAKEGQEAAQAYLDYKQEEINARIGQNQAEAIRGREDWLGRTIGTGAYAAAQGLDATAQKIKQAFSDERLPTSALQYGKQYIYDDLGPFGRVAYDLISTTSGILPSVLASTLVPGAGLGVLAISGYGQGYNYALSNGYSEKQAMTYGTLVGASQALLQKLLGGIGQLGGMSSKIAKAVSRIDNALLRASAQPVLEAVSEFGEEYLEEFLDPLYRNWILGEQNNIEFLSDEELYSGFLGALSSLVLNAPANISNFATAYVDSRAATEAANRQKIDAWMADLMAQSKTAPVVETGTESTVIDTNPATHTPQEQAIIEEYQGSVDEELVEYYDGVKYGNESGYYPLKPVSDRAASDIREITGNDVFGFETRFDARQMYHIKDDHGPNGKADRTMGDSNDVGRIQYVLDNYDSVEDGGSTDAYWETKPNGHNRRARTVIFSKKVNGTYYVVEAAPVTKARSLYVVSAYMSKGTKKTEAKSRLLDAEAPRSRPEPPNAHDASNSHIPQPEQSVKRENVGDPGANPTVTNQQKIDAMMADIMQNNPQSQQTTVTDPQSKMDAIMADVIGGNEGKDAAGTIENQIDRGYNINKKMGDIDNGEEIHLRNGSQRAGSTYSGRPVSAVEEGARRNQVWYPETAVADSAISSLSYGQEVSTASLGIPGGSTDANIRIVTGGETAAIRAARRIAAENGLKLTLFAGDNLKIDNMYGKTDSVRGYIMGDKVYVRADHPKYTAEQLMRHEAGHAKINRGEIDVQAVRDRIDQKHTDYISTLYAAAYEGSDLTPDEIWAEVICDSLADMNVFAPYRVGSTVETLLNEVKESTVAEAQAIRGTPADVSGKMSREELFGGTFPPYNVSHSDANEQATRWAHQEDVRSGDRKLFWYHGSWYLVEAFDNADLKYQITEKLTQRQYNAYMKEKQEDGNVSRVQKSLSSLGELDRKREWAEGRKRSSDSALAEQRGENLEVRAVGGEQDEGRQTAGDGNGNLPRSRSSIEDARIEFENSRGYKLSKRIQQLELARKKAPKGSESRKEINKELRAALDELKILLSNSSEGKASRELNLENLEHWIEENYSDDVVGDVGANPAVGAADSGFDPYSHASLEHGAIPPGENPARVVDAPKSMDGETNVMQTVRTILEASATPDAAVPALENEIVNGGFSAMTISDEAAASKAENTIKKVGYQQALADWFAEVKAGKVSKDSIVMGETLYNAAVNAGDIKGGIKIAVNLAGNARSAAQALQAVRMLKKMSPSARLYGITQSVSNLQEKLIEKYGDRAPDLVIDENLAADFLDAKTDEARAAAEEAIYASIGQQMPSTFSDKWNAFRYLAMLGNARTHVRNIIGNAAFAPVRGVKNMAGALMETIAERAGWIDKSQRTKSIGADRSLRDAAKADYENVKGQIMEGGKWNSASNVIDKNRTIFDSMVLEALRKGNSYLLDAEDALFSRSAYASSLAGYLKAQGFTAEDFTGGGMTDAQKDAARAYAIKEAQKATYRDLNALSEIITSIGFKNVEGSKSEAAKVLKKGVNAGIEGVMPFKKTPANILARAMEYSPAGLAKAITTDIAAVKNGKITAAEYIDRLSSGLTGTAITALGYFLAKSGLLTGGTPEDEEQFDLEGRQPYSLEIGGKSITLDWLAPEAMPLFMGVELHDALEAASGSSLSMETIGKFLSGITGPMLEMSMMSGLQDALEATEYADNKLYAFAANAALGYFGQAFPTLFGQLERALAKNEAVRQTTFTQDGKFLDKDTQYALGKTLNKVPFLDYGQVPYIDAWGRTEDNGGTGERLFNNLLNPAYVSDIQETEVDKEIKRLEAATGKNYTPSRADKVLTFDGKTTILTPDEYVTYATAKGQNDLTFRDSLLSADGYSALDDETKGKAFEYAKDYADVLAKKEAGLNPPMSDWQKELEGASQDEITDTLLMKAVENQAKSIGANKYDGLSTMLDNGTIDDKIAIAMLPATTHDKYMKYKNDVPVDDLMDAMDYKNKDDIKQPEVQKYLELKYSGNAGRKIRIGIWCTLYAESTCPW